MIHNETRTLQDFSVKLISRVISHNFPQMTLFRHEIEFVINAQCCVETYFDEFSVKIQRYIGFTKEMAFKSGTQC